MPWQLANGWESANPALNSSTRLFNGKVMSVPRWRGSRVASCQAGPDSWTSGCGGAGIFLSSIEVVCACRKWEINPPRPSPGLFFFYFIFFTSCWNLHKRLCIQVNKDSWPMQTWELLVFVCVQSRASSLCKKEKKKFYELNLTLLLANRFTGLICQEK